MTNIRKILPDVPEKYLNVEFDDIQVNKKDRKMTLLLADGTPLSGDDGELLSKQLKNRFSLNEVIIKHPVSSVLEQQQKIEDDIINRFIAERSNQTKSEIILGKKIKKEPVEIDKITPDMGRVCTKGQIFAVDFKQRRDGAWIVSADITNKKDSISLKFFCDVPQRHGAQQTSGYSKQNEVSKKEAVEKRLKKGVYILVSGELTYDKYMGDYCIFANDINEADAPPKRMDNAEEKRVELHMHTQMSTMDGVSSVESLIARAEEWGHKAIAITDHGVVQAFPNAAGALKGKNIKVIYGVEGYVVDDSVPIAYNVKPHSLQDTFVVFDLETTGLSKQKNHIIEIGAVKIQKGEIVDSFSTFVDPGYSIPYKITELTSITDAMVAGAPTQDVAVDNFCRFCEGACLVAHNAKFDTGFIQTNLERRGISFDFSYIDTVALSRKLYPSLRSHKLNIVAKHLGVKLENHHRAVDDALATANIFKAMLTELEKLGVDNITKINSAFSDEIDVRASGSYHIIILAKNQKGLENLYHLISESHLNYFYRTPKMPKSIINKYREGLIIGSACEAGELYRAVFEGKTASEIDEIAKFYDYYEVQPLGNNEFMLRNHDVNSVEELQDINKKIISLAKKHGKLCVATGDVHFMDPEDEVYRRVLMAGKGFDDADFQAPLYFRTTEEMLGEFSYLDRDTAYEIVVTNPGIIADSVDKLLPVPKETYPPHIEGAEDDIVRMSTEKAISIYGDPLPPLVQARMDKELKSITTYGFSVMYIIAQKLVAKSLSDGYLVGSRGSVGSSFVAFLSGITEVNSLPAHYICPNCKNCEFDESGQGISGCDLPDRNCPVCGHKYNKDGHDIPFETFLGFEGDKEPDIDLNFSGDYQSTAHRYVEELFGEGYVFRAGTIGTIADKTAYGYVKKYFDERGIVKHNAEINRITAGCTGVKRTTGQHPAGMMIVPKECDIHMFTPVQHPADDSESSVITTHFDYHSISGKILKLDILGHDDPTVIRMLEDLTGVNATEIPLDDKPTLSLFLNTEALGITPEQLGSQVATFGVPEFGTAFVRQMLMDTEPTTFSELLRISGLSHGTDVWLNNAQDYIRSGEIVLKEAICTRDDIMIYLIHMGLEPKTAFNIMEAVRKGKGLTPEWEQDMRDHNVPDWYIDSCKKIKYMFPKAHAVAYVMMAFRIAYFKVHYPVSYYCAFFSIRAKRPLDGESMCYGLDHVLEKMHEIEAMEKPTNKDTDLYTTLELCREMYCRGIKFLPVDLYKSHPINFIPINDTDILPPLSVLSGVSEANANAIAEERKKGEFLTVDDLHERTKISNNAMEALERNGCLKGLPESSQVSLFDL